MVKRIKNSKSKKKVKEIEAVKTKNMVLKIIQ
mgnify:CR=1 FL=1